MLLLSLFVLVERSLVFDLLLCLAFVPLGLMNFARSTTCNACNYDKCQIDILTLKTSGLLAAVVIALRVVDYLDKNSNFPVLLVSLLHGVLLCTLDIYSIITSCDDPSGINMVGFVLSSAIVVDGVLLGIACGHRKVLQAILDDGMSLGCGWGWFWYFVGCFCVLPGGFLITLVILAFEQDNDGAMVGTSASIGVFLSAVCALVCVALVMLSSQGWAEAIIFALGVYYTAICGLSLVFCLVARLFLDDWWQDNAWIEMANRRQWKKLKEDDELNNNLKHSRNGELYTDGGTVRWRKHLKADNRRFEPRAPALNITSAAVFSSGLTDEDVAVVCDYLRFTPNLTHLYFSDNAITDTGAAHIAQALPSLPNLKELYLGGNRVGKQGAVDVAKAVRAHCNSVRVLSFWDNQLGEQGVEDVAKEVGDCKSLTWLQLDANGPVSSTVKDRIRQKLSSSKHLYL